MTKAQLESQRQTDWIARLATVDRQLTEATAIQQALLAAMQDVGSPKDVIESEHFCSNASVPATEVHLIEAMGGSGYFDRPKRTVDKYLEMRKAR